MVLNIYGLQKVTLLDVPGHVACTIFVSGCNFRCPYCHNKEIVNHEAKLRMASATFLAWLETRKGKLDGVCITGGEPTLHGQLDFLIWEIKRRGFLVKLDTNGYLPSKISRRADYIAMDIKNSPSKYAVTAGVDPETFDFQKIEESVRYIMRYAKDYEFRTTVTRSMHTAEDFKEIGKLINGAKRYFLQKCTTDKPDAEDMQRYKKIMESYVDSVEIRG